MHWSRSSLRKISALHVSSSVDRRVMLRVRLPGGGQPGQHLRRAETERLERRWQGGLQLRGVPGVQLRVWPCRSGGRGSGKQTRQGWQGLPRQRDQ